MGILAVTGLAKEARIARRAGLVAVVGACDRKLLEARLAAIEGPIEAVVSFGIAGSLSPLLTAGDIVVANHVVSESEHYVCDPKWSKLLHARLSESRIAILVGVDAVVSHIAMKKNLMQTTGAHAVDMESHIAAAFAKERGVPFAAVRTISDGNNRTLPPAALEPLKPTGKPRLLKVMKSLVADPGQFMELVQTGRESGAAFKTLKHVRRVMGAGLGCPYIAG